MMKPVVVCFDAGSITPVVEAFRKKYPSNQIIIAADGDEVGRSKAETAANKYNCKVIAPEFPVDFNLEKHKDFNDLHVACGLKAVRQQLTLPEPEICEEDPQVIIEPCFSTAKEPCRSFHVNVLPPILREYVSFLSERTNAHPIMITASVLAMVSGYLGTKVYISDEEYFQDLYPNLWMLCIARSGQFKTTALNKGAKIAYENQSEIFKAIKDTREQAVKDKITVDDDHILKISRKNVVLPSKITAEGFLEHLSQGHEGAVFASEFGGWLQNLDKNHNNDFKAILTEFYDVPMAYRYKTKTQGDCIIQKPFMSICGVSTMAWISLNLKSTDISSGFFARFLILTPPYQEETPLALPAKVMNESTVEEDKFKQYLKLTLEKISDTRAYKLSDDACKQFTKIHNAMYDESKQYDERAQEILQPYLKRWSPYLLKIAMIMQVFIDADTDVIDDVAILIAYDFLLPAIRSTTLLLENELGESEHQGKCRKLYEWISARTKISGKPVKRQTIMSSKKLDGGTKEFDYILQSLIDQGKIECKEHLKKNESEYFVVDTVEKN